MSKTFWKEFFDVLSWLILILIIIYSMLKLAGLVYNFNWAVVIGGSIVLGRYMQKIDAISHNLRRLKNIGQIIKYKH